MHFNAGWHTYCFSVDLLGEEQIIEIIFAEFKKEVRTHEIWSTELIGLHKEGLNENFLMQCCQITKVKQYVFFFTNSKG